MPLSKNLPPSQHYFEDSNAIRTPQKPPVIQPLNNTNEARPEWSVMIPVYNCIAYIEECIQSVLNQGIPMENMQIEVIDDYSLDGDIEQLVADCGKGRVKYFRQSRNKGSLRNFETCINRAKGKYVHILHGDDKVKPGFYKEIGDLFSEHPQAGAAFSDCEFIDDRGKFLYTYDPMMESSGIVEDWLERIAVCQRVQPPSMVIKRSVYEHLGSYFGVHYGEDWEMYVRIAAQYPVAHSVKHLAEYRVHGTNITSQSIVKGQNVRDIEKVISIIKNYLPKEKRNVLNKNARIHFSKYFATLSDKIYHDYANPSAAINQAYLALMLNFNPVTVKFFIKILVKRMFRYKNPSNTATTIKDLTASECVSG